MTNVFVVQILEAGDMCDIILANFGIMLLWEDIFG